MQAAELLDHAQAAVTPHLREHDRRAWLAELRGLADPQQIIVRPRIEPTVHDPAAAADWFAAQGMRVVRSEEIA